MKAKRAANIAKHGVDLTAIVDFEWETALVRSGTREGLWRVARSGSWALSERGFTAVVFAEPEDDVVRVISLRRATKKEMMFDAENS